MDNNACDYMYKVYQPVVETFKKETKSKQRRITILNDGVLIQRNELGHSSDYNERTARHSWHDNNNDKLAKFIANINQWENVMGVYINTMHSLFVII